MADQSYEKSTEIRFATSHGIYKSALWVFLLTAGVAAFFLAFEIVALTENPTVRVGAQHHRIGIFSELRAAIIICCSGLIAVGVVVLVAVDSWKNWRYFRRLRKPGAVVDAEGVRFEGRGRAVSVPWSDIEQLVLSRFISSSRSSSTLKIQICADSAPILARRLPVSSRRWHSIGELERQVNIPYDEAVQIINRLSGSRLQIVEQFSRNRRK